MKNMIFKTVAASLLMAGFASCSDDLNISSIDPQSSTTYTTEELLAKQYATLAMSGQDGGDGDVDISGDGGEVGFYRTFFNLQELCSDECIWAWQTDTDIPAITNIAWTSSSTRVNWCYQRLSYNVTLYNQFIAYEEGELDDDVIAEVRFLRALCYTNYLDLFHKAPFKDEFNGDLPVEKGGKDLYDWIDNELTEIEDILQPAGTYNNSSGFGRADAGAAYALHARLALNSEIYTDGETKDYSKAVEYATKLIEGGAYSLSVGETNGYSGYEQVFMGNNDENTQAMNEIIFPIRQDGLTTRSYTCSTYLVSSMRISGMPYCNIDNYWSCNFARQDLVEKFFPDLDIPMATESAYSAYCEEMGVSGYSDMTEAEIIAMDEVIGGSTAQIVAAAGDDRALFYMGGGGGIRSLSPGNNITGFTNGASIVKWSNVRTDGSARHDDTFSDTDVPLFRLAEAYLTRAEANYRLGNTSSALSDLNVLQSRANATLSTSIDEQTLIDEWCKEFYMEGRRRSDLVRFGLFTGSSYLWDFKGGVSGGTGVESKYAVYPIPDDDLAANPNMTQNDGY